MPCDSLTQEAQELREDDDLKRATELSLQGEAQTISGLVVGRHRRTSEADCSLLFDQEILNLNF